MLAKIKMFQDPLHKPLIFWRKHIFFKIMKEIKVVAKSLKIIDMSVLDGKQEAKNSARILRKDQNSFYIKSRYEQTMINIC